VAGRLKAPLGNKGLTFAKISTKKKACIIFSDKNNLADFDSQHIGVARESSFS